MYTNRWRRLQIPLPCVMGAKGFVGEDTGGTDFHQIAAKFAFQRAILKTAEIDVVMDTEDLKIIAAGIVVIETYAPVAGDAAVHFVIDKRAEILVIMGSFQAPVATKGMPGHDRHVLQMTFAAFFAYRTVVGMVSHQQFDIITAKLPRLSGGYGNAHGIRYRGHTGHDQAPMLIFRILVLDDRALPAGTRRSHRRMPAKIGEIQAQG